jgi:hypothetical protein
MPSSTDLWPELPYDAWKDTYATLHMWLQVVGKVALAQAPPLNHCWSIAFQVTERGLSTRLLPYGERSFAIEFDFVRHRLIIATTDGVERVLPLSPRSVAEFHAEVMQTLREIGLPVRIWPMPVEIPDPIRFDADTGHRSYDAEYANRFWRILVQVERVFARTRCGFIGKASPVHFFWGSCDLAVTRFSGRKAPAREGPAFMRQAYSHEVISHGFWPGSGSILEPAFYAYAVPQPEGFEDAVVPPEGAYFDRTMSEFVLPYEAVRRSSAPDEAIASFVESTYAAGATLGHWDRASLESDVTS